jgi:hypothetical protein
MHLGNQWLVVTMLFFKVEGILKNALECRERWEDKLTQAAVLLEELKQF